MLVSELKNGDSFRFHNNEYRVLSQTPYDYCGEPRIKVCNLKTNTEWDFPTSHDVDFIKSGIEQHIVELESNLLKIKERCNKLKETCSLMTKAISSVGSLVLDMNNRTN